ncbi:MAG TPA: hypothetical protein VFM88_21265 [Vicinamibacteria bacterium]|nr:hypothetical protein [Vicinamibacteria bacterium]
MKRTRIVLCSLALAQVVCHQAILTAPTGSTITLIANPTFIAANGEVAVISALVIEPAGTPVPDGTVVQFFTTLGRIDEQGKTNDGVARVNLVSDTRSGSADVTAASGPSTATTTLTIGSGRPSRVFVTADPNRILDTDPRHSRIVATVYDENGNPVWNVPVIFTVDGTPSTEFMRGGGAPAFTNTSGEAIDFLETRHQKKAPPKTVTVRATTPTGVEGTVQVTIN